MVSCKTTKNQHFTVGDDGDHTDEFDQSEEKTMVGEVIEVKPSGERPSYLIRIVTLAGDTTTFSASPDIATNFSKLRGKRVGVSYSEITTHVVYDMRIANDEFESSLHEVSTRDEPGKEETYSIIGRYVYAEPRDRGMYLEIEGRYGTIYELTTEITHDEWADEEVECAIRVIVEKVAHKIDIK